MLNGKPLAIELFAGSFGWSAGWLAIGGRAIGFDIEHLPHHGPVPEGAALVLQDVMTLHGSQFKDADVIFCSPPCQKYSWLAMPWSKSKDPNNSKAAKELRRKWETEGPDNRLFEACFRIQREAIQAAGRYIPLIVENVCGAQPWVGRSAWNFGSFHLWGDVPALMPIALKNSGKKLPGNGVGARNWEDRPVKRLHDALFVEDAINAENGQEQNPDGTNHPPGSWFRIADSSQGDRGGTTKNSGGSWFGVAHNKESGHGRNPVNGLTPSAVLEMRNDGLKHPGDPNSTCRKHKAASAMIARIPYELSEHIARVYWPKL